MDATMMKAGLVAALGLTLLVPTFNALNLSYVENVQPPPWMPPPTQPPNITPPPDFKPPTGMTPPPDWKGEIPPGSCPPPLIRVLNESVVDGETIPGPQTGTWSITRRWTLPEGAVALGGFVNFTQWQGRSVNGTLAGPTGFEGWGDGEASGGLLIGSSPQTTRLRYNSTEGGELRPTPKGDYELTLRVDTPIGGNVQAKFFVALACGGMMSR